MSKPISPKHFQSKCELAASVLRDEPDITFIVCAFANVEDKGKQFSIGGIYTNLHRHTEDEETGKLKIEPATIGDFVDLMIRCRHQIKPQEINVEEFRDPESKLKQ